MIISFKKNFYLIQPANATFRFTRLKNKFRFVHRYNEKNFTIKF